MANRKAAVVGPPDYQAGMIRIVELGDDFQQVAYHQTLGWVALEILVQSPDDLVGQLEGLPFIQTGGPGSYRMPDGKVLYRAVQFTGPSGEPLFMTRHMALDEFISAGRNNVGPLFIQTLVSHPYQQTRDFYQRTLGMKSRLEIDVSRANVAKAFGLPPDRKYKMAAVRAPENCSIQIDEYPEETPERPAAPGCFTPGATMCTFTTHDLDTVAGALKGAGVEIAEISSNSIPPFMGSRAIFCRGYSGERVEIVEVGET
jgi:catechol 2,3-dioxygenase-like lactoylglutathione lyase family enzyme